ncbi:MAG: killer suppression protein [Magnetococcales bacterium]|nr:killer suppression protein [Magnetococcales bacterium]
MDINFQTTKLAKAFNEGTQLETSHGPLRAKKIRTRLKELRAAQSLQDLAPPFSPPARCHEISQGYRYKRMSVDLDNPYRLIFKPDHNPVPLLPNGGLDWSKVTIIQIIGIENTHEQKNKKSIPA